MRYWIGLASLLYAAYFVFGIIAQRRRVREARAALERSGPIIEKPVDPNSMAAFGEMMAPIVQCALAFLAAKICFAYYVLDAGRFVSLFDLAGALALLAAYGAWISAKTNCRMPNVATDVSRPEAVVLFLDNRSDVASARPLRVAAVNGETVSLDGHLATTMAAARGERIPLGLE